MRGTSKPAAIAIGLAAVALTVASGLAGIGQQAARAQGGAPPPCGVDKVAAPSVVPLAYSTRVTLTVRTACVLSDTVATRVVLVVDASGSMAGGNLTEMKAALDAFVTTLGLPAHPDTQVALVKFNTIATTLCKLTNDPAKLGGCIRKLDAAGGSAIDAGIRTGMRELVAGRPRGSVVRFREAMILVTDGNNNAGCGPVLQASGQAKSQAIALATVAYGAHSDVACLAAAATPGLARQVPVPADLTPVLQELARLVALPAITRLQVVDRLPPNMRLEPGTVKPAPVYGWPDGPDLRWEWGYGPAGDHVVTYAVTPLELGEHPVNVAAEADLAAPGRSEHWVFPVPRVRVVDAPGLPTPTPFPTPTPGAPPAPQPTWVPTPVPTSPPPPTRVPGLPFECPGLTRLAPAQAIADALANPARVGGWGQPCNPSLPPGPQNPSRTTLGLQTAGKPYHPVFNGLVFKCGCP